MQIDPCRKIRSFKLMGDNISGSCTNDIQYNLNGSNTDGSFTVDDLNSFFFFFLFFFFSPNKILPIAQENKYLMTSSYFIMELYTQHTIIV